MIQTSWPCLTLTQTRGWEARDRPDDSLRDYAAVVAWGLSQGVLEEEQARALLAEASRRPDRGAQVLGDVVRVRSLLYRIFSAVAREEAPAANDVADLNRLTPPLASRRVLVPGTARWTWRWEDAPEALDRVLWPVLQSAVELLTSDALPRLKQCEGDGCGWLFVDVSRNRSRRWCDMSECGNLHKVRRYRRRHAQDSGSGG